MQARVDCIMATHEGTAVKTVGVAHEQARQ